MKLKLIAITAIILLSSGLATADITFDHSGNIIFDTSTEFNDNVDLNDNILGFPTRNCPDGEAVTDVNDDGSVQCSEISGGGGEAQNLSEVLDEGNTANQDIDMDGNEIIMLEAISGQDTDIRVDSELNLLNNNITNLESLENFFNSACTADEAVTDIQDDGTLICNEVGSSEGEALNLSQVLEEGNVANQSIEFEEGIEIGGDTQDNDLVTEGEDDISIGRGAQAVGVGDFAIAIGRDSSATSGSGIAIGGDAGADIGGLASGIDAEAAIDATALGPNSKALGQSSTSLGLNSEAPGDSSIAIGDGAESSDQDAISLGRNTEASGYGVAIGHDNSAQGTNSLAMLGAASAETYSIAIGGQSGAQDRGVAVGNAVSVDGGVGIGNEAGGAEPGFEGKDAVAVGNSAWSDGDRSIAIGTESNTWSGASESIALGYNAMVDEDAEAAIAQGYNAEASGDSSIAIGDSAGSSEMVEGDIAMGTDALAEGGSIGTSTALGRGAEASGDGTFALGDEANATGELAGSIGGGSMAHGYRSTAVGTLANATSQYNTAVGMYSWTQDDAGTAIGYNSQAQDQFGTALGTETFAEGYSSLAVGGQAVAEGDRSVTLGSISGAANRGVAVGSEANASTQYSVALGQLSSVTGDQPGGMALGRDATAQGSGIAIGENAVSDENRTAVFGGGIYDYDVDVTGDLSVDGHIENEGVRDVSYSSGHTAWGSGLDSEEVHRFGTTSSESVEVERLDVQLKGGGSNSNFEVEVYDAGSSTVLGSTTAGTPLNDVGTGSADSDVTVRVTNNDGSDVTASITVSGHVVE